jgi:predicted nuclease of predicted toxin-antitoxin system
MKIYADENIESAIIEGLRRRKIDVISAVELRYRGKPDEFHLMKAAEREAVVLTHDVDFLIMANVPGLKHRGIIFAHSKEVSIGECIRGVELITSVLADQDMKNHIEFL